MTCALMQDTESVALMVTGGDTLAGVMRSLKVEELIPKGELLQEVVYLECEYTGIPGRKGRKNTLGHG